MPQMGGLTIFNHRCRLASDDLVFPASTEVIVRFVWWIVILCLYVSKHEEGCSIEAHVNTYIILALILNPISIIMASFLGWISSRGSISNSFERRHITKLIYARVPVIAFEFIWNIIGTFWSFGTSPKASCEFDLVLAAKLTTVACWLFYLVFFIHLWFLFDPLGSAHTDRVKLYDHSKQIWKRRIKLIFCCASGDNNASAALEDVADVLTGFFADADLVLTDVWAGLLLLWHKQFAVLQTRVRSTSNQDAAPEWMNLNTAFRYNQFALGVYGWPYYVCDNLNMKAMCGLFRMLNPCTPCRCDTVTVIKDNSCLCNTAALKLQTGLADTELFYISFNNRVYEVPFTVCVDLTTTSIVVAIRGSLSLRDAVTDLCMNEESFELPCVEGVCATVHKGILSTARYVHSVLESEKILDDLYILHPHFHLVLTGHSLGGAVAAVLGLILKPKYPDIRCFAFAPPGCVVSENIVPYTRDFILSIVVGDDLIPRLSACTAEKLKANIIHAVENCDRPKYEILVKGCFRLIFGPRRQPVAYSNANGVISEQPSPEYFDNPNFVSTAATKPLLGPFASPSSSYQSCGSSPPEKETPEIADACSSTLRIPGRILHITTVGSGSKVYNATWTDQTAFQDIVLSSSMVVDHMPYNVNDVLRKISNYATEIIHIFHQNRFMTIVRAVAKHVAANVPKWQPVIGLEIHAQIACVSKLFSSSPIDYHSVVNTNVSHFDCALPGTLPVLNRKCVEAGVLTALGLNCRLNFVSVFDRKHYFYADLPAGYQITQQRQPLAEDGFIDYYVPALTADEQRPNADTSYVKKRTKILRLQLEQDSGKTLTDAKNNRVLIDLNRAGTALMEIVTEPNLSSGLEAACLLRELRLLLRELRTCEGQMNEAHLRCDANISISRLGDETLGTRTEVKNLNSFKFVTNAVESEIKRQIAVLDAGNVVIKETRSYDETSGSTKAMRDKELWLDYRFMPEPNLPSLRLWNSQVRPPASLASDQVIDVDVLQAAMPTEMRIGIRDRWIEAGVPVWNALFIAEDDDQFEWFSRCADQMQQQHLPALAVFLEGYRLMLKDKKVQFKKAPIEVGDCVQLVAYLAKGFITLDTAIYLARKKLSDVEMTFDERIKAQNLRRIHDRAAIDAICSAAIAENVKTVQKFKQGKTKMLLQLLHIAQQKCSHCVEASDLKATLLRLISS